MTQRERLMEVLRIPDGDCPTEDQATILRLIAVASAKLIGGIRLEAAFVAELIYSIVVEPRKAPPFGDLGAEMLRVQADAFKVLSVGGLPPADLDLFRRCAALLDALLHLPVAEVEEIFSAMSEPTGNN